MKWIRDLFSSLGTFFKWVLVVGIVLVGVLMVHRHFKTHPEQLEKIGTAFDEMEKKVEDRFKKDPATAPATTPKDPAESQEEVKRVSEELATLKGVVDDLRKKAPGKAIDPKIEEAFNAKIAELARKLDQLQKAPPPVVEETKAREALVKLEEERRNREAAMAAFAREMAKKLEELQKATRPVVEETKAQEALAKLDEERKAREDLAKDMVKRVEAVTAKVDGVEKSLIKTQGDLAKGHGEILAAIEKAASERRSAPPPTSATLVAREGRGSYSSNPDVNFVTALRRLATVQTVADMNVYRDKKFAEIDRGVGNEEAKEIKRKEVIKQIAKLTEERVKIAQDSARRLRDNLAIDEVQRGFAEDVYTALRMGR